MDADAPSARSHDYLTPREIADLLPSPCGGGRTISLESIYRRLRAGRLPAVRLGRTWFVLREDAEKLLQRYTPRRADQ